MNKTLKKVLIALLIFAVFIVVAVLLSRRKVADFHEKYQGTDLSAEVEGAERTGTYEKYLLSHEGAAYPQEDIEVDLYNYTADGNVTVEENYEGVEKALFTDTHSVVTWTVNIPEEGFYNLYMEYLAAESRGVAAERKVLINDELPFDDATSIEFTRIWTDKGPVKIDNQGNEIRPTQVEIFDWQNSYFVDDMGYVNEPYLFYFNKGENKITFDAINEPVAIKKLEVRAVKARDSYQE